MKKEREVPTIKCAVLAFCFSILTLMSACAAAPAEAAGSPAEQIAAIEETTETEDAVVPDAEQEETTVSGEAEEPAASAYDTSAQYSAAVLADGDEILGGTYIAEGDDESVLEASGSVQASVIGAVLQKLGGSASSADASSFRGVNAGVRVYGNAVVSLTDCEILATAPNATGVFAYEDGVIYMDNCTVNVTGGGAGGVQVAGGGTLIGQNLTVTSASKAAIRSDRGGGTLILDGGSYTSTGSNGCPAIYSTADITVRNADCISENSRAVIIEGKNSVTLENCTLSGNDQSTKANSVKANVLLYQSASGDASVGTSIFTMRGGSMTCQSGSMFYVTNTDSVISLEDAALTLSEDGTLLICSAGRWGKDGRNGSTLPPRPWRERFLSTPFLPLTCISPHPPTPVPSIPTRKADRLL